MNQVDTLLNRFKSLEEAIEIDFMPGMIKQLSARLEDKIIEQLDRGERGDGKVLPVYSPVSVQVYGKPPGPIKLKHTGEWREGIFSTVDSDGIEFDSKDPKNSKILHDYGEEVLDLQPRSIGEFNEDDLLLELKEFVADYLTS
jgi:hypothetical protein